MTQSVKTRAALITRLNERSEVLVVKLEDEFRLITVTDGPDGDLRIPVTPGLYFLDFLFVINVTASLASTNGMIFAFTGPLGLTDGGYGSIAQLGIPQRNTFRTGLNTVRRLAVGAAFINQNVYLNESGWFAARKAGDLVFNWTSIIVGGAGVTLQRGSSIHLVRAVNDKDE